MKIRATTLALLLGLQFVGVVFSDPVVRTLAAKDFASELPEKLRQHKSRRQTFPLSIVDPARVDVLVHLDSLVEQPDYFRKIAIEVTECPPEVSVGASIGQAINLGTVEKPRMAVPLLLQWSGAGWLRTEKWTVHANGKLIKG